MHESEMTTEPIEYQGKRIKVYEVSTGWMADIEYHNDRFREEYAWQMEKCLLAANRDAAVKDAMAWIDDELKPSIETQLDIAKVCIVRLEAELKRERTKRLRAVGKLVAVWRAYGVLMKQAQVMVAAISVARDLLVKAEIGNGIKTLADANAEVSRLEFRRIDVLLHHPALDWCKWWAQR